MTTPKCKWPPIVPGVTKFNRLLCLEYLGGGNWLCLCDCGERRKMGSNHLRVGTVKSCGCYKEEVYLRASLRVEERKNPLYPTHAAMLRRCFAPNNPGYSQYGGRGITVCRRWARKGSGFGRFLEKMGPRPSDQHSLDRIDNDGNYSCGDCSECKEKGWPFNCRWATREEQNRNKRSNVFVTWKGQTKVLADWATEFGLSNNAFYYALKVKGRTMKEIKDTATTKIGVSRKMDRK